MRKTYWNSDSQNEFFPELEKLSHSDHGRMVVMGLRGASELIDVEEEKVYKLKLRTLLEEEWKKDPN